MHFTIQRALKFARLLLLLLLDNNRCGCGWDGGDCCGHNGNNRQFDYCFKCKCLNSSFKAPACAVAKYKADGICDDNVRVCYCRIVTTAWVSTEVCMPVNMLIKYAVCACRTTPRNAAGMAVTAANTKAKKAKKNNSNIANSASVFNITTKKSTET